MSAPKLVAGMEHFSSLTRSIYVHEPAKTASSSDPQLILLVGWMDASMRHIAKYTAGYEKLYPSARIVVITTSAIDATIRTNAANIRRVAPILEIMYALPSDAKVLLHFFSNGGCCTTTMIAKLYEAKIGRPLPATAMVLDSTPGKATYEATVRALSVGLSKNFVIRLLGISILRIFYWLYRLYYWIEGHGDLVDKARVDLNRESLFDIETPRLYIYSVADQMVAWEFVEKHSEEAEATGYKVYKKKYLDSGHCVHLMKDEKLYWGSVSKLWRGTSEQAPLS